MTYFGKFNLTCDLLINTHKELEVASNAKKLNIISGRVQLQIPE